MSEPDETERDAASKEICEWGDLLMARVPNDKYVPLWKALMGQSEEIRLRLIVKDAKLCFDAGYLAGQAEIDGLRGEVEQLQNEIDRRNAKEAKR